MDGSNELYYILAKNALETLVAKGLITQEEYSMAEWYIAEKYRPLLRSI